MNRAVGRGEARGLLSCLTDENLRIVDADDDYANALGFPRQALIGRDILSLTHPDDREVIRSRAAALVRGGAPFSITKRYLVSDGRSIWATSHVSLFLAGTTRRMMATVEMLDGPSKDDDEQRSLRRAAEQILAKRRLRRQFFDEDLFGEPAFDLLLDLYAQDLAGRATYTTSAAVASGAPLTTALRQIAMLVDRGLIAREADPIDRRRVLLRMTADGSRRMADYIQAAEQS